MKINLKENENKNESKLELLFTNFTICVSNQIKENKKLKMSQNLSYSLQTFINCVRDSLKFLSSICK